MTKSPAEIAREQLYALTESLGDSASKELRLAVGTLATQVEIAARLEGIEKSLDLYLPRLGD